jgi:hypothetical protein
MIKIGQSLNKNDKKFHILIGHIEYAKKKRKTSLATTIMLGMSGSTGI